jgi:Na+/proline symporter
VAGIGFATMRTGLLRSAGGSNGDAASGGAVATGRKPGIAWLCGAAMLLSFGGAGLYYGLLGNAFARTSGVPAFPIMLVGVVFAIMAVARRPGILSGLTVLVSGGLSGLLGFFLFGYHLPAGQSVASVGGLAPDFALASHDGQTVRLSDFRGKGPLLLVFYRGFW